MDGGGKQQDVSFAVITREWRAPIVWVFTQMTPRQNFSATPGTDWTVFVMLSIGHHDKFDARASKFDASVKTPDACLCENPLSCVP